MNFRYKVNKSLEDPLKTFRVYEILIAVICIATPAILKFYDTDTIYPLKVKFLSSGIIEDSLSSLKKDPLSRSINDTIQYIDKDRFGFRNSISDYAYSTNSYLFGMLLTVAAMLFIFNGAVYFKTQRSLQVSNKGKWYNVMLGFCLLGVICCPHRDWQNLHYLFAGLFFFGNAIVMGVFHNKKDRKKRIIMAVLTGGFLLLTFLKIQHFTIFWGEWASLTVIGIHFILEARAAGKADSY